MTKSTEWPLCPAKTQISLGLHLVWSESSLSAWRKLRSSATHWAHCEDSDWTDAQADSSLLRAQRSFCWFCHEAAQRTYMLKVRVFPNYKYMIRIIWFCIVLTANTCSLHENQHYHVCSSVVYVKQAMTLTLLLALVAIVITPNNVKTIFIVLLH